MAVAEYKRSSEPTAGYVGKIGRVLQRAIEGGDGGMVGRGRSCKDVVVQEVIQTKRSVNDEEFRKKGH